mmetsp:Transcript_23501/g.59010  ORF Transcript_23501/g.59010 Transcript_23501/m.59010 type:complete len:147 (+) Transcript_23501:202-642(+)
MREWLHARAGSCATGRRGGGLSFAGQPWGLGPAPISRAYCAKVSVKLTDYGLTSTGASSQKSVSCVGGGLPFRWMSPEAIQRRMLCWQERAADRPAFAEVKRLMLKLSKALLFQGGEGGGVLHVPPEDALERPVGNRAVRAPLCVR